MNNIDSNNYVANATKKLNIQTYTLRGRHVFNLYTLEKSSKWPELDIHELYMSLADKPLEQDTQETQNNVLINPLEVPKLSIPEPITVDSTQSKTHKTSWGLKVYGVVIGVVLGVCKKIPPLISSILSSLLPYTQSLITHLHDSLIFWGRYFDKVLHHLCNTLYILSSISMECIILLIITICKTIYTCAKILWLGITLIWHKLKYNCLQLYSWIVNHIPAILCAITIIALLCILAPYSALYQNIQAKKEAEYNNKVYMTVLNLDLTKEIFPRYGLLREHISTNTIGQGLIESLYVMQTKRQVVAAETKQYMIDNNISVRSVPINKEEIALKIQQYLNANYPHVSIYQVSDFDNIKYYTLAYQDIATVYHESDATRKKINNELTEIAKVISSAWRKCGYTKNIIVMYIDITNPERVYCEIDTISENNKVYSIYNPIEKWKRGSDPDKPSYTVKYDPKKEKKQ